MLQNFVQSLKKSDKYFTVPLVLSFFTTVGIFISYFVLSYYLPFRLPLFYSRPWGASQLVTQQQFYILPLVLFLINLTNFSIAWNLHSSQIILQRILMLSLIPLNLIVTIAYFEIISLFI